MKVYGVIMAGGSGTRFWPLSRKALPKQFLNLTGRDAMVNVTFDRLSKVIPAQDIFVVTGAVYGDQTYDIMAPRIQRSHILEEPSARNTAACIGYAAMEIMHKYGDGVMCIMPSDHYVRHEDIYARTVQQAAELAWIQECLVTIGIEPTYPATGYGYIKSRETGAARTFIASRDFPEGEVLPDREVECFVEKPDAGTAAAYLEDGGYDWNSGMFFWKASVILEYFRSLLPEVYGCLDRIGQAMDTEQERKVLEEVYPTIPSISIDYGIMEHAQGVRMLPGRFGWSDVGSFEELSVCHEPDEKGNIAIGKHVMMDTTNSICYSKEKMIAVLGVENLVVVETEDAVLVCGKNRTQDIKKLVEELENSGYSEYL